jgi:DNA ligase (NAD+)
MTRQEAKEHIQKLGGKVTGSVSSKTDYLVYGADPGAKMEKAQDIDIRALDEDAFMQLVVSLKAGR